MYFMSLRNVIKISINHMRLEHEFRGVNLSSDALTPALNASLYISVLNLCPFLSGNTMFTDVNTFLCGRASVVTGLKDRTEVV